MTNTINCSNEIEPLVPSKMLNLYIESFGFELYAFSGSQTYLLKNLSNKK